MTAVDSEQTCSGCGRAQACKWSDYYGGPACPDCRAAASFWREPCRAEPTSPREDPHGYGLPDPPESV